MVKIPDLIPTIILLTLFTLLLPFMNLAQTADPNEPVMDDIQSKLPPLQALIDSAIAHDPYVSFRNRQITINNHKLFSDQKLWMRDIGFQADVRYGNFDNWSTNTAEGQSPATYATNRTETKYGMGAYIKFPLFDIINRRNQINLAKTEVKQAQDMLTVQGNEVRQQVIRQYNDLILKQKLLQIRIKYLETSRLNLLMSEKEFINGVISLSEYTRLLSIGSQAETDYESAKMDFKTSYMILEEIVGMKLNINIDTP